MRMFALAVLAAVLGIAGCAKKDVNVPVAPSGETAKADSSLAYEHAVSLSVPRDVLEERMNAVREACADDRFGHCNLLRFEESSGNYPRGMIVVRIEPAGVEPLVGLASKDGQIGSRQTHAEDLAEVVADNARQTEQLEAQRDKLVEFQDRKDLAVGDMISLAHELASVESQLTELSRTSARLQQRIDTNLLTLDLSTQESASRWSSVGGAFSDFLDSLVDGTSEVVGMIAFGLPFLLVLFPLALAWRWLWRRATRKSRASMQQ
ncbi:MAG: DUF4349 domain-containing protein [Dokdonella sp.]